MLFIYEIIYFKVNLNDLDYRD